MSLQQQTETPVGNSSGAAVLATTGSLALLAGLAASSGTYGSFSWEHDLSPVLSTNLFAQYRRAAQRDAGGR